MKHVLFFIFLLFPIVSHAKIYILIDEASSKKFPIAVPEFLTVDGNHSELTQEMTSLLRKDLQIAGMFKVLDERHFLEKDTEVDQIDFSKWTAIEAFALVKGLVDFQSGGRILAELRLYDTETQKLIVGKQYGVSKKNYTAAIHRFVDELMKALTGSPGPFSSAVVAACGKQNGRQLVTFGMDGTQRNQITKLKGNNISPNWSPDGLSVAFTSFIKYYPEIFSISPGGGGLKQLTNDRATSMTPAFSPSGDTLVYASTRSGDAELYLMSRSGHLLSRLTTVLNIDVSPAWSPDGQKIVFASERAGNLHLFSMGAGGGGGSRLTYTGYQNDQPDWSPDGRRIVFTARDRGAFDIFMMNADGSMIQRLTRDEGNNESPTWSPDSRYISFSRGGSGVYVMMDDGGNQTPIPNTGGCINPDWGPWMK